MKTYTYQGRAQTLPAWAAELGIPVSTLRSRLNRLGQTIDVAFSAPSDARFRAERKPSPVELPKPVPELREDERGRAVARWVDGTRQRKKVFGKWADPAAHAAYRRWAAEWLLGEEAPAGRLSVAGLILQYLDFAERTYLKRGRFTSEVYAIRAALQIVNDLYGDTLAGDFGPKQLAACQAAWVRDGLSRKTCNEYLARAVRCFSWGAGRALIPARVADALRHVPRIRAGRIEERAPVQPAAVDLERITPHLHPDPARNAVLAAVVRLLAMTGARPSEILELRPIDVDTSREPWSYVPASGGKTAHLGKGRRLFFGPKSRVILAPWLEGAPTGEPLFRLRERHGERLLKIRIEFLRLCLARACRAAGESVITPYQLRHAHATRVHQAYESDEAVAAALGNSPEVARAVYVDRPADRVAARIAEELG